MAAVPRRGKALPAATPINVLSSSHLKSLPPPLAFASGIAGGFISRLLVDAAMGRLKETEVSRAIDLRNIMTSLGPAYIKLGQALSIRPDLLSPAAMNELQKLCDKVPSFDNKLAMQVSRSAVQRGKAEGGWCSSDGQWEAEGQSFFRRFSPLPSLPTSDVPLLFVPGRWSRTSWAGPV